MTPDCTYQPQHIHVDVQKGEDFTVQVVAVDQVQKPLATSVRSILKSSKSGLGGGLLLRTIDDRCSNLTFSIFSLFASEQLSLYPEGTCKDARPSLAYADIHFSPCHCLTGLQQVPSHTNCLCKCHKLLLPYIDPQSCNPQVGDAWISYTQNNISGYLIHPHCPLQYCKQSTVIINLNGSDAQCASDRSGLLCAKCLHGLSLSLGSSLCLTGH